MLCVLWQVVDTCVRRHSVEVWGSGDIIVVEDWPVNLLVDCDVEWLLCQDRFIQKYADTV